MKKACSFALALLIVALAGFAAQAAEPPSVGYILEVEGSGRVTNPTLGRDLSADPQLPLLQGDRISAGPASEIRVVLADESLVQVGAESTVAIDRFSLQPDQGRRETTLELPAGKIRVLVNDLLKHRQNKFEVKTPTAVAAVRGTLFLVLVEDADSTVVLGYDNPVEVSNRDDPGRRVTVARRSFTTVARDQTPTPPAPATDRRLKSYQLLFNKALQGSDSGQGSEGDGGVETSLPVGVSQGGGAPAAPGSAAPPAPAADSGAPAGLSVPRAAADSANAGSPPGAATVGAPPGQVVKPAPSGSGVAAPPGQGGTPPGQEKTPPGQGGTPPGQDRTPPGQGGTPPGQEKRGGR
jgi:hypothetical protein